MASTKATELAQLSRKLTYNEGSNVAAIDGGGNFLTTSNTADDLPVGSTNLYYTDARVSSYLTTNTYATQSYVAAQVSNLVDSAPGALDTLNELAAALGDDANFSTTITNLINTKTTIAAAIDEATALAIALG